MHNPFGNTFESLGGPTGPVVGAVHQAALEELSRLIDSDDRHLISLRAPRAGFGKTMLLARLREAAKAMLVPVHLVDGRRVDGEGILEDLLTRLTESEPESGGLTKLDLITRRLFAHGLLPLVHSGEVPCQDRDGTVASLHERPTEAFDFHRKDASIARWSKDQFDHLTPRLSSALSKSSGASGRDTIYWIELLFRFSIRPPKEISRISDLMEVVFGRDSRFRKGAGFLDGLGSFLNLVTLVEPIVLVLDEVDGLFESSDAALQATSSLVLLWENCRRLSLIVSINDDVWESVFASGLPAGLRDRLEDVVIRLKTLSREEACSLISARAGQEADKVIDRIDLSASDLYPRGILKAARQVWNHRNNEGEFKEAGKVGLSFAKPSYPPGPVRRAALPRVFNVQRIRQEPSAAGFGVSHDEPARPQLSSSPLLDNSPFSSTPPSLPGLRRTQTSSNSVPNEVFEDFVPFSEVPKPIPVSPERSLPDRSNTSIDLSIAIEAIKAENSGKPLGQESFSKPQGISGQPGRPFAREVRTSPFEIVSPAPEKILPGEPRPFSVPDQDENPEAETDAIDDLLRQFREQRDS